MELKYDIVSTIIKTMKCFNRTFMELKFFTNVLELSYDLFQSYLYGIEIDIFYVDDETGHRFQSYLYGIEMQRRKRRADLGLWVSIVPLWN